MAEGENLVSIRWQLPNDLQIQHDPYENPRYIFLQADPKIHM